MADQYYRFFPGDYQRDTGDLSMIEDCAYRRLLDYYYSNEKPLPTDRSRLCRICRAFTTEEQSAVEYIIERYFVLSGDCYRNRKADEEISERQEFREAQSNRGKKGAEARWGKAQEETQAMQPPLHKHKRKDGLPSPSPSPSPLPIKEKEKLKQPDGQDFILPSFDEILFSSGPKTKSDLQKVCKQLYGEKTFPEVYAFSNTQLKAKMNPKAVIHALARCVISKPKEPWGYCQKIIAVENGNYNERDNV